MRLQLCMAPATPALNKMFKIGDLSKMSQTRIQKEENRQNKEEN
jgi:hypothetical protein